MRGDDAVEEGEEGDGNAPLAQEGRLDRLPYLSCGCA